MIQKLPNSLILLNLHLPFIRITNYVSIFTPNIMHYFAPDFILPIRKYSIFW